MSCTTHEVVFWATAGVTHAMVELPPGEGPHPGVVLVDGSGGRSRHEWRDWGSDWPSWLGSAGVATLRHDKPGTGDTSGDWRDQSFDDRATDTIAAVGALARCDGVDPTRLGVWGGSQGGWVAPLAAQHSPAIAFVIVMSAAGISPAAQEAYRIERALTAHSLSPTEIAAGMAWFHERTDRLRDGEDPASVFTSIRGHADAPWAPIVDQGCDSPKALAFLQRCFDFDVLPILQQLSCPLLAMWGADDPIVPARLSRELFAAALARGGHRRYELHVFAHADHGGFIAAPHHDVAPHERLAPGLLATLHRWLA